MYHLFFALVIMCATPAVARAQDTVFYNRYGALCERAEASYYNTRVVEGPFLIKKRSYIDGRPRYMLTYRAANDTIKDGPHIYYYDNGAVRSQWIYVDNRTEGTATFYFNDGTTFREVRYRNGKQHGETKQFYRNGTLRRVDVYDSDSLMSGRCFKASGIDTVYTRPVETMPQFPGGGDALMSYLSRNTRYPTAARENNIEGIVVMQFEIDENGLVGNLTILRGVHPALYTEAIRVIESLPRWQPGVMNGEPVPMYFNLPLHFQLGGSEKAPRRGRRK